MSRRTSLLTLVLIAASTPAALGLEALLRRFLMPETMLEFRAWM